MIFTYEKVKPKFGLTCRKVSYKMGESQDSSPGGLTLEPTLLLILLGVRDMPSVTSAAKTVQGTELGSSGTGNEKAPNVVKPSILFSNSSYI